MLKGINYPFIHNTSNSPYVSHCAVLPTDWGGSVIGEIPSRRKLLLYQLLISGGLSKL